MCRQSVPTSIACALTLADLGSTKTIVFSPARLADKRTLRPNLMYDSEALFNFG